VNCGLAKTLQISRFVGAGFASPKKAENYDSCYRKPGKTNLNHRCSQLCEWGRHGYIAGFRPIRGFSQSNTTFHARFAQTQSLEFVARNARPARFGSSAHCAVNHRAKGPASCARIARPRKARPKIQGPGQAGPQLVSDRGGPGTGSPARTRRSSSADSRTCDSTAGPTAAHRGTAPRSAPATCTGRTPDIGIPAGSPHAA
jgi:hypothetical protein